jgi:ABC-2 type transport system permease protein
VPFLALDETPGAQDEDKLMAEALDLVSGVLPLTYAFDALDRVASTGDFGGDGWLDVAMIVSATLLALSLGALTLRRRTA